MGITLAPLRCQYGNGISRPEQMDRMLPSPREIFPDQFRERMHKRSWSMEESESTRSWLVQQQQQQQQQQQMTSPTQRGPPTPPWDQGWARQMTSGSDYTTGSVSPGRYSPRRQQPRVFSPIGHSMPRFGGDKAHIGWAEGNRRRRGNHPRELTSRLKAWYDEHYSHPYPTEEQKRQLMDDTGMTMTQISNWFINHRRRQGRNPPDQRTASQGAVMAPAHHTGVVMGSSHHQGFEPHGQAISPRTSSGVALGNNWSGQFGAPQH